MGRAGFLLFAVVSAVWTGTSTAAAQTFETRTSTGWHWNESVDRITGALDRRAYLLTAKIAGKMLGAEQARLMLICLGTKPELLVEWSFEAAGKANLVVDYRFAGQAGKRLKARFVNRTKQSSTDINDIRTFIRDAQVSKQLLVRVTSDLFGGVEAEFPAAAGLDIARRFTAACPAAAG